MTEEHNLIKEAVVARVGADRMAEGLSCIPDPIYGDLIKVQELHMRLERLQTENWQLRQACGYPIPANKETPQNPFKCGVCAARQREYNQSWQGPAP